MKRSVQCIADRQDVSGLLQNMCALMTLAVRSFDALRFWFWSFFFAYFPI